MIPSSAEIQNCYFIMCWNSKLTNIQIVQYKNENVRYFDDSLLIGKSTQKKDNFDVLIVARKDIKIKTILSFIK